MSSDYITGVEIKQDLIPIYFCAKKINKGTDLSF
jgi:hypothetical protein